MQKNAILFLLLLATAQLTAQQSLPNNDYTRMVSARAYKITAGLGISDSSKFYRTNDLVATQYSNLNDIYTQRDKQVAEAKKSSSQKDSVSALVKLATDKTIPRLDSLHKIFLAKLSKELSTEQVEKIKDGMTYGVLPITYKGYQAMLPNLTAPQKAQIMTWLIEAREYAMDAESSEKKHAWFGKYKGRINNYLSSAGYDLKKAGEEWQERIKAEKTAR